MSMYDEIKSLKSIEKSIMNPESVNNSKKDIFRDELGDITVDTCKAFDTGRWETGVEIEEGHWTITEQYDSREEAAAGHKKYVELLKTNPKAELPDIHSEGNFDWNNGDE